MSRREMALILPSTHLGMDGGRISLDTYTLATVPNRSASPHTSPESFALDTRAGCPACKAPHVPALLARNN